MRNKLHILPTFCNTPTEARFHLSDRNYLFAKLHDCNVGKTDWAPGPRSETGMTAVLKWEQALRFAAVSKVGLTRKAMKWLWCKWSDGVGLEC